MSNPASRPVLALQAVVPATTGAAINGAGSLLPLGYDLSGVQFNSACSNYNAQTLACKLQGSNAPGDSAPASSSNTWADLNPAVTASFAADGSARPSTESRGVSTVGGYRWLRLVVTPTGAIGAGDATVQCWIVPCGSAGY